MSAITMLCLMFTLVTIDTQASSACDRYLWQIESGTKQFSADELDNKICAAYRLKDINIEWGDTNAVTACDKYLKLASERLQSKYRKRPYTKKECEKVFPYG